MSHTAARRRARRTMNLSVAYDGAGWTVTAAPAGRRPCVLTLPECPCQMKHCAERACRDRSTHCHGGRKIHLIHLGAIIGAVVRSYGIGSYRPGRTAA